MKIITNTASSLTQEEGKKLGISIIPVSVSLGGRSLRDYTDITSDEYVKLLHGDEMPVSSQPSLGDMLQELEGIDEDVIMLTVADGLSGEYSTAMSLRERLPNRDRLRRPAYRPRGRDGVRNDHSAPLPPFPDKQ